MSKDIVTNPKASDPKTPQVGGVTNKETDKIFNTSGSEPVRDRTADKSKGTPVTRYFTKDGTPVEPSTVPPAKTPANLAGFDASKRDDLVEAVEYIDENGSTVTNDSLKAKSESKSNE